MPCPESGGSVQPGPGPSCLPRKPDRAALLGTSGLSDACRHVLCWVRGPASCPRLQPRRHVCPLPVGALYPVSSSCRAYCKGLMGSPTHQVRLPRPPCRALLFTVESAQGWAPSPSPAQVLPPQPKCFSTTTLYLAYSLSPLSLVSLSPEAS